MKNFLKDKKVIIGGVVVLGLVAFYYNKGKKVLANSTPNSYSNADGIFSSTFRNLNLSSPLGANSINIGSGIFGQGNLGGMATASRQGVLQQSNGQFQDPMNLGTNIFEAGALGGMATASRQAVLAQSLAQFQANSLGGMATATPIVTSSGIKVLPNGVLQPFGLKGVITTFQSGLLGSVPVKSIKEIIVKVENQKKSL